MKKRLISILLAISMLLPIEAVGAGVYPAVQMKARAKAENIDESFLPAKEEGFVTLKAVEDGAATDSAAESAEWYSAPEGSDTEPGSNGMTGVPDEPVNEVDFGEGNAMPEMLEDGTGSDDSPGIPAETVSENALPNVSDNIGGNGGVQLAESATYYPEYGLYFDAASGTITGMGESVSGQLNIPEEIDNVQVTKIGVSAFRNCDGLTEINIPKSIQTIGAYAFAECDNLASVTLNYNDRTGFSCAINDYAFSGCSSLTELVIPESVTYLGAFFIANSGITSITIPNSVTDVGCYDSSNGPNGPLANCPSLTEVILKDGRKEIPNRLCASYDYTSHIACVNIPESVTKIGYAAFSGCSSLTELVIPDSVTFLGERFIENTGITSITIPNSVTSVGVGYDSYNGPLANCPSLTEVILEDGRTEIPDRLFASYDYTSHIAHVNIPESVTKIGIRAFQNCDGLTEINIPKSVHTIGEYAFAECDNLASVTLNYNDKEGFSCVISHYVFSGCGSLTELVIPEGVTEIGVRAFENCDGLTEINIPKSVHTIGAYAFEKCDNLASVTLNYNDKEGFSCVVNDYAFSGCGSLTELVIPESVTEIGKRAFENCDGLTEINIPKSVHTIGEYAFAECDHLASVTLHDNDREGFSCAINDYAFSGCGSLTELVISENVTYLGARFIENTRITSITIPNSVTRVGYCYSYSYSGPDGPLANCSRLTEVILEDGRTEIPDRLFASYDYTSHIVHVNIPESVTKIGYAAFRGCNGLTRIDIPDKVTSIGESAFQDCSNLAFLTIPENVTSIGSNAFYCTAKGFKLLCYPDSYAISYAEENNIPYELVSLAKSISLTVTNADGEALNSGFMVRWYTGDSSNVISTGHTLVNYDPEQQYYVEVIPTGENAGLYYPSGRVPVIPASAAESTTAVCSLDSIAVVQVSGTIRNSAGAALSNVTVKALQRYPGSDPVTVQTQTGADGEYSFQLKDIPTTIQYSLEGYYQQAVEIFAVRSGVSSYTMQDISLIETPANKIDLSILRQAPAETGTAAVASALTSFDGLTISLIRVSDNQSLHFTPQYPSLYLSDGQVSAGDRIRVSVTDQTGETLTREVVLDESLSASTSITFLQNGQFCVRSEKELLAYVFNSDGSFVSRFGGSTVTSGGLTAGEYDLVLMENKGYAPGFSSLSQVSAMSFVEDTDYLLKHITIEKGVLTDLGQVPVPSFDAARLYRTVEDDTWCISNKTSVSTGVLVSLKTSYRLKTGHEASGQKLMIDIPEGMNYVGGSLTVDGIKKDGNLNGRTLEVTMGADSAVARIYVMADKEGSYSINSSLSFSEGGQNLLQPVGTAKIEVSSSSLQACEATGYTSVVVSGKTTAKSTVTVYDNGAEIAKTTANAVGSWSVNAPLVDPANIPEHELYAEISTPYDVSIRTDSRRLRYIEGYSDLKKITMINTAHPSDSLHPTEFRTVYDFTSDEKKSGAYNYWWEYPDFTFTVELSGPAVAVQVVTLDASGRETSIDCVFDEVQQLWVGTHAYMKYSDAPTAISARVRQLDSVLSYRKSFRGNASQNGPAGENQALVFPEYHSEKPAAGTALSVLSVSPNTGGAGEVTVAVHGSMMEPNLTATLSNGTDTYAAKNIWWVNHQLAYAKFDLSSAAGGTYTLSVSCGGERAGLDGCFTLDPALPKGKLEFSLNLEPEITSGNVYLGTIQAKNTGYTDVAAPVVGLNGENLLMRSAGSEKGYSNTLIAFLQNLEGLAGIIAPQQTAGCNISYKAKTDGTYLLTMEDYSKKDGELYGQAVLDDDSDKSAILTANMLSLTGTSYMAYSKSISEMANEINTTQSGELSLELLEDVFRRSALNAVGNDQITSADDLVSMDLSLSRVWFNKTNLKNAAGSFGAGWASNYDTTARHVASEGQELIAVESPAGSALFVKENGVFKDVCGTGSTASVGEDGITVSFASGKTTRFNADGTLRNISDPSGNLVSLSYTEGKLSGVTSSDGDELVFTYTGERITNAKSLRTNDTVEYRYDGDRLAAVTTAYGTTSYGYDTTSLGGRRGTLTSITYPDGSRESLSYDSIGRFSEVSNGELTISYRYGLNSVTVSDSEGNSRKTMYNVMGSPVYTIDAAGSVSYAEYDGLKLTGTGTSLTGGASLEYDSAGKLTKVTQADGSNILYGYGVYGKLASITEPTGAETKYNRDANGNTQSIVCADGTSCSYTYDDRGRVLTATDQKGVIAQYAYDASGLVTSVSYSTGDQVEYTYDAKGNLTAIKENGKTTTLGYNERGDLTRVDYPHGRSVSYTYDELGRKTSVSDGENVTSYEYDAQSRLSRVYNSSGTLASYSYNPDSTVSRQTNGNGTYTDYAYEAGRLKELRNCGTDGSVLSSFTYAYNESGQVASITGGEGTESYSYDALGQMVQIAAADGTVTQYSYDPAGNRTKVTVNGEETAYTANNMNRYTEIGGTSREYDACGNLTREGGKTYTWDYLNRLTGVTTEDGTVYAYTYDAFGLRDSVTVNGVVTEYLNDPTGDGYPVASFKEGRATSYVLANGIVARQQDGETYFSHYNHLGSTTELTDSAGTVLNRYRYDHQGRIADKSEKVENPFTYVGRYGIAEDGNGLWYMRARYVSQESGSFISPDPAGQNYDLNLYRYANNDFAGYIDISGFVPLLSLFQTVKYKKMINGLRAPLKNPKKTSSFLTLTRRSPNKVAEQAGAKTPIDRLNSLAAAREYSKLSAYYAADGTVKALLGTQLKTWADEPNSPAPNASGTDFDWVQFLLDAASFIPGWVGWAAMGASFVYANREAIYDWWKNNFGDDNRTLSNQDSYGSPGLGGSGYDGSAPWRTSTPKNDPSGYVYAGVASNRLEGVKVTVYYEGYPLDEFGEQDTSAGLQSIEWTDAADYGEINPQLTDAFGQYGWDVPVGKWRVRYEKEGYEIYLTDWMEVPPEYTEVNISLKTTTAPKVETVNFYSDGFEIAFDQYMEPSTVTSRQVKVQLNGEAVSGTVEAVNSEPVYGTDAAYANIFRFVPDRTLSGNVSITVSGASNYAGIPMTGEYRASGRPVIHPASLELAENGTSIYAGSYKDLKITVLPLGAAAGQTVTLTACTPSLVSLSQDEAIIREDGTATFTIQGRLPGTAVLQAAIKGTDLTQIFSIGIETAKTPLTPADSCVVKFETGSPSEIPEQTIAGGGRIIKPADPVLDGYTFAGWYRDPSYNTPWNFNSDTVISNITLYAKWDALITAEIISSGVSETIVQLKGSQEIFPPETIVYAAWYDGKGKMLDVVSGTLDHNTLTVRFSKKLEPDWILFILDPNFRPVCNKIVLKHTAK